jgi:hypothetical protein
MKGLLFLSSVLIFVFISFFASAVVDNNNSFLINSSIFNITDCYDIVTFKLISTSNTVTDNEYIISPNCVGNTTDGFWVCNCSDKFYVKTQLNTINNYTFKINYTTTYTSTGGSSGFGGGVTYYKKSNITINTTPPKPIITPATITPTPPISTPTISPTIPVETIDNNTNNNNTSKPPVLPIILIVIVLIILLLFIINKKRKQNKKININDEIEKLYNNINNINIEKVENVVNGSFCNHCNKITKNIKSYVSKELRCGNCGGFKKQR